MSYVNIRVHLNDLAGRLGEDYVHVGELLTEIAISATSDLPKHELDNLLEGLTPAGRRFIKQIAAAIDEEAAHG